MHDDPIILDWVDYITNEYQSPEGLDDVLIFYLLGKKAIPHPEVTGHLGDKHNAGYEVMVTSHWV